MDADKITEFSVSYGDCPIVNIRYSNKKLTVFNRINGSRDGWMSFPEGYFDEKHIVLSEHDDEKIKECLKELSFEKWTTSEHILKNHLNMATGFCVHNSFRCSFDNGSIFECLEPETREFKKLVSFIDKFVSSKVEDTNIEPVYEDDDETIGVFEKSEINKNVNVKLQEKKITKQKNNKYTILKLIGSIFSVIGFAIWIFRVLDSGVYGISFGDIISILFIGSGSLLYYLESRKSIDILISITAYMYVLFRYVICCL